MAEITKLLRNQRQEPSFIPRRLTRQEIEELRRDKQEASEFAEKWFQEQGVKQIV